MLIDRSVKRFNILKFEEFIFCTFIVTVFTVPRVLQEIKILLLLILILSFIVNNVTNVEYTSRPGDVRPPTTYMFQLAVKL